MMRFRLRYGEDPTGRGFFWPQSRQKRGEAEIVRRNAPDIFAMTYQCDPALAQIARDLMALGMKPATVGSMLGTDRAALTALVRDLKARVAS